MINELPFINEIFYKINVTKDENEDNNIKFYTISGKVYTMYHSQDCCELVYIEDINGNIDKLIGYPIIKAEERIENPETSDYESITFTFYTIASTKGYVDIRWHGESNGYYSESVDIDVETYPVPSSILEKYKILYPEYFI